MSLAVLTPRALLIGWLLLPYLAAFLGALLPLLWRPLGLGCIAATAAVALATPLGLLPDQLDLLGVHGVALQLDALTVPFLGLNALVGGAVLLERWSQRPAGSTLLLLLVLHGGLNAAFVAADLISLYVCLEVVGLSAFLLMLGSGRSTPESPTNLWVALRYLLVGNAALTLYLVGAAVVYLQQGSFRYEALASVSGAAAPALLLVGLLCKSGLFLAGLWLPRTHAEAPAAVSALLSGVVVTAGALPLLRLAALQPALLPSLQLVGAASAGLGLLYALAETDAKRLLAWSTVSQMGLVVLSPAAGGSYALAHGLAKATLFLLTPRFPSRQLSGWRQRPLPLATALPLGLASLSICGLPLLLGGIAKADLGAALDGALGGGALGGGAALLLNLASVGTTAVYARLWGMPLQSPTQHSTDQRTDQRTDQPPGQPAGDGPSASGDGRWSAAALLPAAALLLGGLLAGAGLGDPDLWGKSGLILLLGVLLEQALARVRERRLVALPDLERFPDLVGGITLVGALLLLVLPR